jgi:hypothetical protein
MADEEIHTITSHVSPKAQIKSALPAPRVDDALNVVTNQIHVAKLDIEKCESKSLTSAIQQLNLRSPFVLMLEV